MWSRAAADEGAEHRAGRQDCRVSWLALRLWSVALLPMAGASPAFALELSAPQAALYTTVSIYPPSASAMTVCYGFVCRRREILDFTPADRSALTQILAAGRASAAAERAAVQKAVIWFDRRMGPVIGTNKRVAKADFRYFDDKHNYDCWDTTRNTTSLLLVLQEWGLLKYHVVGDPHYRGNALVLQTPHNTAVLVETRDQGRMGRRHVAARLRAAAGCHDRREMGQGRLDATTTPSGTRHAVAMPASGNAAGLRCGEYRLAWKSSHRSCRRQCFFDEIC